MKLSKLRFSLRLKLSLWYVFFLFIILTTFSFVLYSRVNNTLAQNLDQSLLIEADSLSDVVVSFWENQGIDRYNKKLIQNKLEGLLLRWGNSTKNLDQGFLVKAVRLLSADGKTLVISERFQQFSLPLSDFVQGEIRGNKVVYETFQRPMPIRLITFPIIEENKLIYILQLAVSTKREQNSLASLRLWLFLLVPGGILGSVIFGWLWSGRVMIPLQQIISQSQKINIEDLHQRLKVTHTKDELEDLSRTLNQMLDRLEIAFKRLRQFSAAASHELRTPLTVMKGELEVSLRRARSAGQYKRVLKTTLNSINQMTSIVEQLLLISRVQPGKESWQFQTVDLQKLLEGAVNDFRLLFRKKKILVQKNTKHVFVNGEERLLYHLFVNLLENAYKHTPLKGQIKISLKKIKHEIHFVISDSESGIPPEEFKDLFDQFFKRKNSDKKSYGIGLGLCRYIVEIHNGQIAVKNLPSKGAQFTVILPVSSMTKLSS